MTDTAPDLTSYIDLAVYDRDPASIVAAATTRLITYFPDLVLREGLTEAVLIEAVALEIMEAVYAVNRLPGAITQTLLRLFGIERDEGTPPTATIEVTVVDNAGYVIEAGAVFRLDVGGEYGSILFTTDEDLVIAPGNTTGPVAATGDRNTDVANGTAAGTALAPVAAPYSVSAAELDTAVADGSNVEDTTAWLDRGINRLRALVTTLVLPHHFTAFALAEADVDRATTLDAYDGVGANTSTDYGHVTVAVLGDNGATLSAPRKAEIEAAMEEQVVAGLDVHVIDPTITAVEVDVTVLRLAGYDDATVEANVDAALAAYLDPGAWPWSGTVYLYELVALIDAVDGVDRVTAITIEGAGANYVLAGVAPLADYDAAASVTTVTAP